MKKTTEDLSGRDLSLAVAMCEYLGNPPTDFVNYATDKVQMELVIRREGIVVDETPGGFVAAMVDATTGRADFQEVGADRLEAAGRCYVSAEYGEFVDLPDALLAPVEAPVKQPATV